MLSTGAADLRSGPALGRQPLALLVLPEHAARILVFLIRPVGAERPQLPDLCLGVVEIGRRPR